MRALSKLINLNNPDLVLFVGEALVGNDAVDQLSKFNQVWLCKAFDLSLLTPLSLDLRFIQASPFSLQKLADMSTSPDPRLIDGILLTKFDTIDDKVSQFCHLKASFLFHFV